MTMSVCVNLKTHHSVIKHWLPVREDIMSKELSVNELY